MWSKIKIIVKNYLEKREINQAYEDFTVYGYCGLSKRQHEIMRQEYRKQFKECLEANPDLFKK
jgi:hypothetical protein